MTTQTRRTFFSRTASAEANFEEYYRAELPRVYNFFRYRVGNDQIAEDLTSETFEKAWRNRERYRYDLAAFSTWLFTIARRVAQHDRDGPRCRRPGQAARRASTRSRRRCRCGIRP